MVRFYILPNADHLVEDELNFEIKLRNVEIELDAKIEDRRRALRYAYKTERNEPKLYDTGIAIGEETKTLENVIKSLKRNLRESFDYVIVSRLRHYLIRLSSSRTSNEEEKELKDDCCKQIEEILRANRQRVTYDPIHLNDETDHDLGEGAKALKTSWRNPDPNAFVLVGNQSNNTQFTQSNEYGNKTGTIPKDSKKREDNRNKEERRDKKIQKIGDAKYESGYRQIERTENLLKHMRINDYSQRKSKKEKKYKKDRSHAATDYNSESSEGENTADEGKRRKTIGHGRSRGRYTSTSNSSSSSTEEEEEPGRWVRERNPRRSHTPERHYRAYRDDYYRASRSRVENWDIVFSGDARSMQVEDFLNRVKKLAKHERVSKMELLDKIHYKLKGEASDWWFTREDHCDSWEKFESEIRFRFGNPNRDRGIRTQLRELRQKRGETFVAFVTEVEKLNQCLKRPHSSRTIFEIVWENMRPHYRSKLATTRVHNLERLLDLNHRIDATDPNLYRSAHGTRNDVNNVDVHSYSEDEDRSSEEYGIHALQRKPKLIRDGQKSNPTNNTTNVQEPTVTPTTVKCWNCQKTGHHWRTCNEIKLIFCYACGNLGRTTRTCERNHPHSTPSNQIYTNNQQSLN